MGAQTKKFDAIVIGTGSGLELVNGLLAENRNAKIAVIDKDDPGGICLTRGCIPSKILISSADMVRTIQKAGLFGIVAEIRTIDFDRVMGRMRQMISTDMAQIADGLRSIPSVNYFQKVAEFTGPYTLSVDGMTITAPRIFLGTGSHPAIPPVEGLEKAGYLTSDTLLSLTRLPGRIAIIGGGYIAAEYGHFFSAMGAEVTIIGRNPRFLHEEEPEVSFVAEKELRKHLTILKNHEVRRVVKGKKTGKTVVAVNLADSREIEIPVDEIIVAVGRSPNSDILHPERGGIAIDKQGWIVVNDHMETSQPGIWAFGDADGKHLFKHVANHEAAIVYFNAIQKMDIAVDYHAVPHAIFTDPEIARVGMGEQEAVQQFGEENVLIGFSEYAMTAKGSAIGAENAFVKLVLEATTKRILGVHIIGPEASVLIQELVTVMYTAVPTIAPVSRAMHIHPALPEVVYAACHSLMPVKHYHHVLQDRGYEPPAPDR